MQQDLYEVHNENDYLLNVGLVGNVEDCTALIEISKQPYTIHPYQKIMNIE
jgi:hypothetical protein